MKAKFLVHFPQKVHVLHTHTEVFLPYTYTFSKPHFEMQLEINATKDIPKHLMNQQRMFP